MTRILSTNGSKSSECSVGIIDGKAVLADELPDGFWAKFNRYEDQWFYSLSDEERERAAKTKHYDYAFSPDGRYRAHLETIDDKVAVKIIAKPDGKRVPVKSPDSRFVFDGICKKEDCWLFYWDSPTKFHYLAREACAPGRGDKIYLVEEEIIEE